MVVKRRTSLFDTFCINLQNKLHVYVLPKLKVITSSGYSEKRTFLSAFFELPFYSVSKKFQTFTWIFENIHAHTLGMLKECRLLAVPFSVKICRVIPASSQNNVVNKQRIVSGSSMLHRWRQSVCGALPR